MAPFDPYHKWLGILPNEHPVNHYRLLGIALFEANADVVDNATELRLSYLRSMRSGAYALYAEQLMGEVERAREVLLEPGKRAQYEHLLRERLAAAASPPAGPAMVPVAAPIPAAAPIRPLVPDSATRRFQTGAAMPQTAPEQPPAINHASDSAAPPTRRRGRGGSGKRFVYNTVLGGALGTVVGYLILCNLRPDADILGLFPDRQPARPETSSPSPQRSARRSEPKRDPIDAPTAPKAPTVRPRSKETIERPAATVKTPDPFVGLPQFVELSEPANLAAVTIAQLPAEFAGPLNIRLESAAKIPEGQRFDVRRNGDAGQFDIVLGMGNGPVVAHVAREGPAIRFRWRANDVSPLSLRQLRNSVLRLESGEASKAIRLRGPVMQPAMRVSLKASRMTQPIAIESPPIPSSLRVQIGDLTQFPVTATIKDDQRPAGIGKPMIVALDSLNDADFPELEIVLLADGDQLRAEIRPRLVTPGKTYDLTTRVVEEQKKWLASRRPVVARELDTVTAEGKAVEARIAKIKSRVPRDQADRRLQAQELPKLRDRLETLNTKYKAIMEQKVQLDRAERGIPPVEELVSKLHDKATIPFRIFALIGETELDLVRSEGFSR